MPLNSRIELHPLFIEAGNGSAHNLALIKLTKELTSEPICWPSMTDNTTMVDMVSIY